MGYSRGGGVSLMLGIRDPRVDRVVNVFGPTDVLTYRHDQRHHRAPAGEEVSPTRLSRDLRRGLSDGREPEELRGSCFRLCAARRPVARAGADPPACATPSFRLAMHGRWTALKPRSDMITNEYFEYAGVMAHCRSRPAGDADALCRPLGPGPCQVPVGTRRLSLPWNR